ncbi:MAG: phytanoyl-CoA dioxygenase family protein [Phenylobacterium sp.]|uniref:phytanoyl-CoA dioxygenase family protein n=1 Tax=Phenylobacterium sp. TaxID=1871053 RepID=UPI0027276F2E|nr:phytanoyl-CoA dioxygenase family protein [Phenylobacterium sp.]MDO8912535.1 phytanoyl-CoA dioxygenase family protein [Phenylobacterium sp.]MDP3101118.1 phytanoyl-CoA dioxygenase family protein [Phenylobacterium sp.]
MSTFEFQRDGLQLYPTVYDDAGIERLRGIPTKGPGARLQDDSLPDLLWPVSRIASRLLGIGAQPVRAVLFDKTAERNWALGWHQDRTLVVEERREVEGFGPWSRKDGALHVAPPIELLQRMATFRIHLDPCGADNAPLQAAVGSHRCGYVAADQAAAEAEQHPVAQCLAQAGDVWAYSTPILHASARADAPARRRVLQVDYATFALPGGLVWRGVALAHRQTAAEWAEENAEAIKANRERIAKHGIFGEDLRRW